jgi:hypothetical protein
VECQHFFRERLVAGEDQPGGARAGVSQIEEIEQRGDVRLERALSPERFGEIEDEVWCSFVSSSIRGCTASSTANRLVTCPFAESAASS